MHHGQVYISEKVYISTKIMSGGQQQNKQRKQKQPQKPTYSEEFISSAAILVGEDVDLTQLPECKVKAEFLELASLALQDKLGSLQKSRLEYLSGVMQEMWERYLNREEIEKQKAEARALREKREKNRRLLRKKTKKGQPNLNNLARVLKQQVEQMTKQ